ncbi:DUF1659 domain-containing protein [Thalassobacillus pellis]|uniref:DUF1659 domain-containing protein n=1 Tax=Thalassobacillus pellis TaxID=748008 RepID=UPI001961D483|nr:DUF1659 domain-containing protein [Thalassobacillus pellis]MBM7552976.1 hypothetical protein [Thalassobacillus pellis]
MAVTSVRVDSTLQMVLETGLDQDGNGIYKVKSFHNVKTDATDDQLFTVANALKPLQSYALQRIERRDSSNLLNA